MLIHSICFLISFLGSKLCLTGSMATGLITVLSDMDLVLVLNDTYIEPQHGLSNNNSGEAMNIDENSCSNDGDNSRKTVDMSNKKNKS